VESESEERVFTGQTERPRMTQKGETFVPHVLPVLVGSTVEFPNEDDFYHNVFSVVAGNRFDLGRYPKGESTRQKFTKPALVVVRCEIHPSMKAFILVLKSPYFASPDEQGRFTIPNVPAGKYTIKAWHPARAEQIRIITVPESGEVQADFTF
jgi:plastocyanin